MGNGQCAGEVGGEHESALQDRHEHGLAILVVACELGAELGDAGADLLLGEIDLAGTRVAGACYEAWFRPYFWARRSKSRFVKSLILTSG